MKYSFSSWLRDTGQSEFIEGGHNINETDKDQDDDRDHTQDLGIIDSQVQLTEQLGLLQEHDSNHQSSETDLGIHDDDEDDRSDMFQEEEYEHSSSILGTSTYNSDDENLAARLSNSDDLDGDQYISSIIEDDKELPDTHIDSLHVSHEYIRLIQNATLDNGKLDQDTIDHLRNPTAGPIAIQDPDHKLSLEIFTAIDATESLYNRCHRAILWRYPKSNMLTFHNVKKLVADISGIVSITDDMCINSCHAFTGPFAELDACTICKEPRYDPDQLVKHGHKVPRQQACTIPLGPQIQTLRRSEEGAEEMGYLDKKIQEVIEKINSLSPEADGEMIYDDIFCGRDFIEFAERINITSADTLISLSIDGVQLYQNKKSDCWIAIWKVENYSPELRFKEKKIFPWTTIPGPNKPKIIDSFTFRGIHHLSALQRENGGRGLKVWDAKIQQFIYSRVLFALGTADAVGITELDGRVGHHGAQGCRFGCGMKGRHKPNSGHYFAAHLKPNDYTVQDCNHPDINIRELQPLHVETYQENIWTLLRSEDQAAYERNRKATGLSKPSLLSGLVSEFSLPLPRCFPLDLMHLTSLNLPELLISLWRGTLKHSNDDHWEWATLVGDVWIEHGKLVENATQYFPSSFHRTPRNPAEKISSGYKATEWFIYIYGLGPAFFRAILPHIYWQNFCKLVAAVRIFVQRRITGYQIAQGHSLIIQFIEEYENLYYQRRVDRLQVCRPSIHTLSHLASETLRVGPAAYFSQYTMERTIGSLGKEIRQPSNPFANLSQRALLRCQLNALVNVCPELEFIKQSSQTSATLPSNSLPILLFRRDKKACFLKNNAERTVILNFFKVSVVRRWGRVHLPNGQIARSIFNDEKRKRKTRISNNVKVRI
ncbi:hypothetical protein C0992_009821 [Termitomyces sp. T32_za158]|nr:hypothetical protein C0992_009821 [Termitomyces sp. T32_za158]